MMEDVKAKELDNNDLIEMYKEITEFINKLESDMEKLSSGDNND
ncbi:MAG: hypothetical protein PUC23_03125 [bacterium]|nr:hypothetical protein [bacterium]